MGWVTIKGRHIFIADKTGSGSAGSGGSGKSSSTSSGTASAVKRHALSEYRNPTPQEVKELASEANWHGGYDGENGVRYLLQDRIQEMATRMEEDNISFKEMLKSDRAGLKYWQDEAKTAKNKEDRDYAKRVLESDKRAEALFAEHFLKSKAPAKEAKEVVEDYKSLLTAKGPGPYRSQKNGASGAKNELKVVTAKNKGTTGHDLEIGSKMMDSFSKSGGFTLDLGGGVKAKFSEKDSKEMADMMKKVMSKGYKW